MSFTLSSNQISITRGDTFSIPVHFHQPIQGATISIAVFKEGTLLPVIQKEITEHLDETAGKSLLLLEKELTDIDPGTYYIQMAITFLNGAKYTFYPPHPDTKALFIVQEIQTV
ncbi:MAG: hypothetical protein J6V53_00685 [Alphaproteobacteria bacterium]|nr:hypothetical protein [Alphaproteobacteria bacterium]